MDIWEAFDIVLELATANMYDENEMPEQFERQAKAIEMLQADRDMR